MRIEITERHIAEGLQESCFKCPVALAIKEVFGECYPVIAVTPEDVRFYHNNPRKQRRVVTFSQSTTDWIEAFDGGYVVQPFAIDLDLEGDEL